MTDIRDLHPSKVIALGLNYRDHAEEFNMEIPAEPILFMKPASAVIYPGDDIVYPRHATRVDYEAELGIVIGERARRVPAERAADVILGYTCINDVTERHMQGRDGQWTRAKSFDTFCPIGPEVVTGINPDDVAVSSYLNGERKQQSRTSNLIFNIAQIIEFVTSIMTLLPGDIIATGTPSGVGPMQPGDEIVIEVEGIGRLVNRVAAE
jgi:2-keto-4-pentenoate hydratase/2-oxohepta-3-ene-1,7-dioic acid hydratase in catechol pathway